MKRIFEQAYEQRKWYRGSGSGSLPGNTGAYRRFLKKYMERHHIKRVLDIGCGDWQFSHLIDWSNRQYIGVDVVASVIENDVRRWQTPNVRFYRGDVFRMKLPPSDLVIVKDVLQHWSNARIKTFLHRVRGYPHILLINTVSGIGRNSEIKTGDARPLDVRYAPFRLQARELLRWRSWRPMKKVWETKNVLEIVRSSIPKRSGK